MLREGGEGLRLEIAGEGQSEEAHAHTHILKYVHTFACSECLMKPS